MAEKNEVLDHQGFYENQSRIYNCGHRSCRYVKKRIGYNFKIVCPICENGITMAIEVTCIYCGKKLPITTNRNYRVQYCSNKCKRANKKDGYKKGRRILVVDEKEKTEESLYDDRKVDCIHYVSECLNEMIRTKNSALCRNCTRYKSDLDMITDYRSLEEVA